jgi:hypothetical protein
MPSPWHFCQAIGLYRKTPFDQLPDDRGGDGPGLAPEWAGDAAIVVDILPGFFAGLAVGEHGEVVAEVDQMTVFLGLVDAVDDVELLVFRGDGEQCGPAFFNPGFVVGSHLPIEGAIVDDDFSPIFGSDAHGELLALVCD